MDYLNDYLSEYESLLDNILNWKAINPDDVKRTQFNRVFDRIEEYSKSYLDKNDWQKAVDTASKMIEEVKLKLIDLNYEDNDNRQSLLNDIDNRISKIFPKIKSSKPTLSTQAKIVLLEYFGLLKPINASGLQNQQQVFLLHLLLERDETNIKKAMNSIHAISHKSDVAKNINSLNNLKEIAELIKSPLLIEKIEEDLRKIEEAN